MAYSEQFKGKMITLNIAPRCAFTWDSLDKGFWENRGDTWLCVTHRGSKIKQKPIYFDFFSGEETTSEKITSQGPILVLATKDKKEPSLLQSVCNVIAPQAISTIWGK